MEDNNKDKVLAVKVETEEKKICKCCGVNYPITMFRKQGSGHRNICMNCERSNKGVSEKFKSFTDRELMEELRARGYQGVFKKTIVQEFKL